MRFETRNGGAQDKDGDSECKSRIRWFRLVRRSRELRKYTGKVLKLKKNGWKRITTGKISSVQFRSCSVQVMFSLYWTLYLILHTVWEIYLYLLYLYRYRLYLIFYDMSGHLMCSWGMVHALWSVWYGRFMCYKWTICRFKTGLFQISAGYFVKKQIVYYIRKWRQRLLVVVAANYFNAPFCCRHSRE